MDAIFREHKFDFVYHLAAEYGRWNGEDHYENLWRTNVVGTNNMLRIAEQHDYKTGNGGAEQRPVRQQSRRSSRSGSRLGHEKTLVGEHRPRQGSAGLRTAMDFDEGLGVTIDWFKANWSKVQRDAEFPPGGSPAVKGLLVKKEEGVEEEVPFNCKQQTPRRISSRRFF